MKQLLALGDSFTYGDELIDRTLAWPNLVGNHLGMNATNLGHPGSGNYRIVKTLLEQDIQQYSLVIIGWSGFDRLDVSDEFGEWDLWPGAQATTRRIPNADTKFRNTLIDYINRYHNSTYSYKQYLNYVILTQAYLKVHNVPYIMLDAFKNHLDLNRHTELDLISKIDTTRYLGWPDQSMQEWTKDTKIGPRYHFLEEGHSIVAKKIIDFIDTDI